DGAASPDGGSACTLPAGINDGAMCTGSAVACSPCGIENQGSRTCTCNGTTQDCANCVPPTSPDRPIINPAVTCMSVGAATGMDSEIRGMVCPTIGETCIASNKTSSGGMRGCVCWDTDGTGLKWRCNATQSWFTM